MLTNLMERTIMLLLISDVHISTLARTDEGVARRPTKVEVAREVERSHPLSILMDRRYEMNVLDTSIFDDDSNILH